MVNVNVLMWVRCLTIAVIAFVCTSTQGQAAVLGHTVTNTASIRYNGLGGQAVTVLTNPADFVIEAKRTSSTVEFFRLSPKAPDAMLVAINGSDYSPSGQHSDHFVNMPPPLRSTVQSQNSNGSNTVLSGDPLDLSKALPLIPTHSFLSGELMFVCVVDEGQNGDPSRIETITTTIETDAGDKIVLRLYESGLDTGEFWAYVPSTRNSTPVFDPLMTTGRGAVLTVTYIDSFDESEVSVDTAVVDPYGHVFNALTGELVDHAGVTLIDNTTGAPAIVYGVDGFSKFPAHIMSGTIVEDQSGLQYPLRTGEFIFPIVPVGDYSVRVDAPEGLSFSSALKPEHFTGLANAPFDITGASYGKVFGHAQTGTINFDIPLDAQSQFVISKTTSTKLASVGDFIEYTVEVDNRGQAGAVVVLQDILPQGFKYVEGSTRLGTLSYTDPDISMNGGELNYFLGALSVGETRKLEYVLEVGAGAKVGEAVNSIVAIDGNGDLVSNTSRANVTVREDLLRSHSTIIGRISENACDANQDWARDITKGTGVAGVRMYMENGAYAITDEEGLYHFEGVKKGTHVVQMDVETLPEGYAPMVCEESSRIAGSDISQFVDVEGGMLWRANFYLKKVKNSTSTISKTAPTQFNDQTEYKTFDETWLAAQTSAPEWVYPSEARTPSIPSVNIGIKHAPGQKVSLSLNGQPVPHTNFAARDSDAKRRVMLSRWRGVDVVEGKNTFIVVITDVEGTPVKTLSRDIHFVKNIARAIALPDQSILVADGRTKPELAVRLEDEAGRPVHAGRITKMDIPAPYHLYNSARLEGQEELVAPLSSRTDIVVGADGIARVTLAPTLQTGKVTIVVTLDNGRKITLFMYLEPEKRDWILVGLAEGSLAHNTLTNASMALAAGSVEGLHNDGRIAFFAKGLVKGNWLLTLAVDTDKRRGDRDQDFETEIDPNAYYTLYGDRSYTELEAASRYPIYIKLEKKNFSAMFGDFDTNITEGKLTRYSRHLSGFKTEYLGPTFQALAYGAQTNQGFAKDEIAADGTSGPYYLSNINVLANSETITIETRDRTRADIVLESRRLVRHLDYTLDKFSGELVFRLPVDGSDGAFNPNVIVIEYETSEGAERNLSYGGRVQKQILNGRVQIGSTFVHEGGNANVAGAKSNMIGGEVIAQLTEGTEFRAEYAVSTQNTVKGAGRKTSNAYLAEIVHTGETLSADAYIRQEQGGFGLSQRSTNTSDIRRLGANLAYKFHEFTNKDTGRRNTRTVKASLYKEENLGTGDSRRLSELSVNQQGEILSASAGLRQVNDTLVNGIDRQSLLALAQLRYALPKHGATFQISHEQPIGDKDTVSDHPQRTRLSVDKSLTDKASLRITHDILHGGNGGNGGNAADSGNAQSQNTAIGVTYAPWAGTAITAGSDLITSDSGRRIGATVGLDQQYQINEKWSASAGVTNRRILGGSGTTLNVVAPDAAASVFEINESFTSLYGGLGYRTPTTSASARIEARNAQMSQAYTFSVAAARELSENLSFAGAVRAGLKEQSLANSGPQGTSTRIEGRIGTAWRPRDEGLVILNRFDISYNDVASAAKTMKLVNNFTANAQVSDRWQLAGNYGAKYVASTFSGVNYSGFTQLIGAETRFDISERIDLGLHVSALYAHNSDTLDYAFGPSIGISPVDNVWISLGYNVQGYKERDFAAAEYSQQGAYLKFRFKFDQNTAKGLLDMVSPDQE